ncbi:MAG: hydroxymethylpyrimidine/phosphomethylpyrimidine kinase [Kofleriaceae bacterium]|nr:hydroxymethylpyrimidine/phosphomethylpyrimidine kinase [Kofleriaceae bacterium]
MAARNPVILTIAGSDSSGGAGIQRDWQMLFGEAKVRTAITAVSAQSDRRVIAVQCVSADLVAQQIVTALEDGVDAVKIGMLGQKSIVDAVVRTLADSRAIPIVVDPVLVSSSGTRLLDEDGVRILVRDLCPLAFLATPNIPEAAALLGTSMARSPEQQVTQARELEILLGCPVLLKGGHLASTTVTDMLSMDGMNFRFELPRKPGNRRGTGCALSSRIALRLARGSDLVKACALAQKDIEVLWD